MPDPRSIDSDFLNKINEIVKAQISNEQFGVSELAREIGMSRSNLLRKVKKLSNLSVSRYIRQIRLEQAEKLLKQGELNVSEISYQVGFGSVSYFIKCFRDQYGYPPGEHGKNHSGQVDQASQSHQLAAIMFTDIEGYTALMQGDEVKALDFRNRHREVFDSLTEKYKGKVLQYFGDGTLSTFSSAIDAVRCGIEMQLAFREQPKIPVRIGIHTGDIIFSKEDIIGDGVNVASRIESLAVAQSVFISGKVYDEVKNQPGIQTVSLGMFEFKNVDQPMEVFAIANPGLIVPVRDQLKGKLKEGPKKKPGKRRSKLLWYMWILPMVTILLLGYFIFTSGILDRSTKQPLSEFSQMGKSIAVLPFLNDSNDSTNVYLINGLMEAILNNLQKIEDLRVISRTSVEKYRNSPKTIPEMAGELNVHYFVEGSGQKIGDQIMLNIQLIEGPEDKHLWSGQYNKEVEDIFELQMEVAKDIAGKIKAIITPEEEERINKIPTDDLLAYDHYLKGRDLMNKGSLEGAIAFYQKAIERDQEFAQAYAGIAICYFFLDVFQFEKQYSIQINSNADKALLYDETSPQSLIAKALYYMNEKVYEQAVPYLEKALDFNPNSAIVIRTLADFYNNYIPNSEKYLEYALKGIQLDIAANDSLDTGYIYLHLSNAFVKTGFISEAEKYLSMSFDYNPDNLYAELLKAYVLYARNKDLAQSREILKSAFEKDTTRLDILQEIGKLYYYERDYESAYGYYKAFTSVREAYNLDIFMFENDKIGLVLSEMGEKENAENYLNGFKAFAENDKGFEKHLNLAMFYSYQGDTKLAIEHLQLFSKQDNFDLWVILFSKIDPLFDNVKDLPEFKKLFKDIENKFWNNHKQIKASLAQKALL